MENKEERMVHCQYCSESFFYEEVVLSTISKTVTKKGKNSKKEKGKGKQSKISETTWPFTHQKYHEMQEDEFKSKKSDMDSNDKKKKKYELRNRKEDEEINENSMSLTDAMSILDKHKSKKSASEDDVMKKVNAQQEHEIEEKLRRRTRSSFSKKTITEMLDEIFEPDVSQETNDSGKNDKNTKKPSAKVLDSSADGKPEDTSTMKMAME